MSAAVRWHVAFAIWDEQEQTLFSARDRFGEKPFYYFLMENSLCLPVKCKRCGLQV
jgi:asparagine synthase (glutamine-hydrolysing)